jgi:hypothetical protein
MGTTPPKDVTVRDGDLWSTYNIKRVHNQEKKLGSEQEELCGFEVGLGKEG